MKHWLVSPWNAKGSVLRTPCQLLVQENKELGNPDTGQLEALESGVALRASGVGKGAICTPSRNLPAALLLLILLLLFFLFFI